MAQAATGVPAAEMKNGCEVTAVFKPQVMVPACKAEEAVKFYKEAFGAEEVKRVNHPKRKAEQDVPLLLCADLKIGTAGLLVCDQSNDSTGAMTGTNVDAGIIFRLETSDVAGLVSKAVKAGAVQEGEVTEEEGPCGGLVGKVKDPFGHTWAISLAENCCAPPAAAAATEPVAAA